MRTPKQPIRATLIAPPFTIDGSIHMPLEEELQQAVDSLSGRFLPVTDAKYWAYGVAESPNFVDLLVASRSRVHVAIPVGTEWSAAHHQGGNQGGHSVW
jgi:hypothetical protein